MKIPDNLIKELETVFIEKIKWSPNCERQYFDIVPLKLQLYHPDY